MFRTLRLCVMTGAICGASLANGPTAAQSVKGSISAGGLSYFEDRPDARSTGLIGAQLESSAPVGKAGRFTFKGVARYDTRESKGRYLDLPIAKYSLTHENWRLDVGFDTVFWGVTESQRVVNVINQPDLLRSLRADVSLGQPMLAASWYGESDKIEAFVLPWFRERRFGGSTFRTGLPLPVDDSDPLYEHRRGQRHVDYALRVSRHKDALDAGLSVFTGTLREPGFVHDPARDVLRPFYQQGTQVGLDVQYTRGPTLYKLEAKNVRPRSGADYRAAAYGIEQVFGRVAGLPFEVSGILEHNWDSRGKDAPVIFQNDLFIGARLDFANVLATTMTIGLLQDLDHGSQLGRVLLETRLDDDLSLGLEMYIFRASKQQDAMFSARDLDQITVRLSWHF